MLSMRLRAPDDDIERLSHSETIVKDHLSMSTTSLNSEDFIFSSPVLDGDQWWPFFILFFFCNSFFLLPTLLCSVIQYFGGID